MATVCLLAGLPGSGKTTLVKEVVARSKVRCGGFYTEEIRVGGARQGFKIRTLDGQDAVLAHVSIRSLKMVSKYGVDIDSVDGVAVPAIYRAIKGSDLIVVDEIGKMELFSTSFREAIMAAVNCGTKVLGTIMLSSHPFADRIKCHPGVTVLNVNRDNRDRILLEVTNWLES